MVLLSNEAERNVSLGAQEDMMAEQGLLEYVEMERKGARCERMCSQVRLLEQCKDIQNKGLIFTMTCHKGGLWDT